MRPQKITFGEMREMGRDRSTGSTLYWSRPAHIGTKLPAVNRPLTACAQARVPMIKLGSAALVALLAVIAADQYFYFGIYTDGVLALLRQVRHSFKF